MSKVLSDALEAMDKATPGPLETKFDGTLGKLSVVRRIGSIVHQLFYGKAEDAKVLAAALDALAWIKEALPTVEEKARHLAQLKREYEVGIKLAMGHQIDRFEAEIKSITTELIALDALIARARPEDGNEKSV